MTLEQGEKLIALVQANVLATYTEPCDVISAVTPPTKETQ